MIKRVTNILFIALVVASCAGGETTTQVEENEYYEVIDTPIGSERVRDLTEFTAGGIYVEMAVGSPPLRTDLERIVDAWNSLGGTTFLSMSNVDSAHRIQVAVVDDLCQAFNNAEGCERTVGAIFMTQEACNVYIKNDRSNVWQVVAHEIGHCIGFGHSDISRSLMFRAAGSYARFTTEQRRLLREALVN